MSDFILQMGFRRLLLEGENGGWMQLLILVVVAVLYGLGTIVKAKKRKLDVEEDEQPGPKPVRKPAAVSRPAQQQQLAGQTLRPAPPGPPREAQQQPQRRPHPRPTTGRPRSALQAFLAEIKRAAQGEIFEPAEEPTLPAPSPELAAQAKDLAESIPKAVAKVEAQPLLLRAKQPAEVDYLGEFMPDFSGRDDLRKGILYYEILGKPVSLRGPSDVGTS